MLLTAGHLICLDIAHVSEQRVSQLCSLLSEVEWKTVTSQTSLCFKCFSSVIIETDKEMSLLPLGVSLPGFPNPFCRLTKLHNRLCNFISAEISEALNLLLISEGWLPVEVWRKEKSSPQCGVSVYLGSSLDLSYLANIGYFMISCTWVSYQGACTCMNVIFLLLHASTLQVREKLYLLHKNIFHSWS